MAKAFSTAKAREFVASEMTSTAPLTSTQFQGESIRFMDFLVQNMVDKYPNDPSILRFAQIYKDTPSTQGSRSKALLQFERDVQRHLEAIAPLNAGMELADATASFCNQIASLTKSKDMAAFALGLSAMTKAVRGVHQLTEASQLLTQATTSAATMASSAAMLGAAGVVLGAGMMLYGLLSEPENDGNGLGEALAGIHQSIMDMWQDTRRNFETTWQKIDLLDAKMTEMEKKNIKRFLVTARIISYYGELTREQQRALKTTLHGSLNDMHDGLGSYLKTMARSDSRHVVSYIGKVDPATTLETLADHTNRLEQWLTQGAAIPGYTGYIPTNDGVLEIESTALSKRLKQTIAPENAKKRTMLTGLYASLAQSLDPMILLGEPLESIVNPQDWSCVLESYLDVIEKGIPLIGAATKPKQQRFFTEELARIKNIPLMILKLMTETQQSKTLWNQLVSNYVSEVQAIQTQLKVRLEEHRKQLNLAYDLEESHELLRLESSALANCLRLKRTKVHERFVEPNVSAWLQRQPLTYDASLSSTPGSSFCNIQSGAKIGPISEEQANLLLDMSDETGKMFSDVHWVVGNLFKQISFDLSCYPYKNPEHGLLDYTRELRFVFSALVNQEKKPFLELTLSRYRPLKHMQLPQYCHKAGGYWGYPNELQVIKRELDPSLENLVCDLLNNNVLSEPRKRFATQMLTDLDFSGVERARLSLLSFIHFLNPDYDASAVLKKHGFYNIEDTLRGMQFANPCTAAPLHLLLSPTLGLRLIADDLNCTLPTAELSIAVLSKCAENKVKTIHEHWLWKTMAHSYASIELLEQRLKQAISANAQANYVEAENAVYEAMPALSASDQAFIDALKAMRTLISNATVLIETQHLSKNALCGMGAEINQLETQFAHVVEESLALNEALDAAYIAPTVVIERVPTPFVVSEERKAALSKRWLMEAEASVNFSLPEAMSLIEKTIEQFNALPPISDIPALLLVGLTQVGKSTLANASVGVLYKSAEDELGLPCVEELDTSPVKAFAKTGDGQHSETLFPAIGLSQDGTYYWVDMPGFSDTRGKPQQISNGVALQCLREQFKTIKGIVIACDEQSFMQSGFVALRNTLEHAGRMLPDFSANKPNPVLLVVTKSTGQRTAATVFRTLTRLLDTEYNAAQTEEALAVKCALLHLTQNQTTIAFVDSKNPTELAALNQTIRTLSALPTHHFNFQPISTELSLLQSVLDLIVTTERRLQQDVLQLQMAMSLQMKQTLLSLPVELPESLQALYGHLKALCALSQASELESALDMVGILSQKTDFSRAVKTLIGRLSLVLSGSDDAFVVANKAISTEELLEKYTELDVNRSFFNRMSRINWILSGAEEAVTDNLSGYETDEASKEQLQDDTDVGLSKQAEAARWPYVSNEFWRKTSRDLPGKYQFECTDATISAQTMTDLVRFFREKKYDVESLNETGMSIQLPIVRRK